jgi:hypothetical protein
MAAQRETMRYHPLHSQRGQTAPPSEDVAGQRIWQTNHHQPHPVDTTRMARHKTHDLRQNVGDDMAKHVEQQELFAGKCSDVAPSTRGASAAPHGTRDTRVSLAAKVDG